MDSKISNDFSSTDAVDYKTIESSQPETEQEWQVTDDQVVEIVLKGSDEESTDVSFGGGKFLLKIRQNPDDLNYNKTGVRQENQQNVITLDITKLEQEDNNLRKLPPDLSEEFLSVGDISERLIPTIKKNAKFPNKCFYVSDNSNASSATYQSLLANLDSSIRDGSEPEVMSSKEYTNIENNNLVENKEVNKKISSDGLYSVTLDYNSTNKKLTPVIRKAGGAEKTNLAKPILRSDNSSISISINLDDLRLAKSVLHSQECHNNIFDHPSMNLYPKKLKYLATLLDEFCNIFKSNSKMYTPLANKCYIVKRNLCLKMEEYFQEVLKKKETNYFKKYIQIYKTMNKVGHKNKEKAEDFKKLLKKHNIEELYDVKLKEPLEQFLDYHVLLNSYTKQLQESLRVVICESIQLSLFERVKFPGFAQLPLTKNIRHILKKYYELMCTGKVNSFEEIVTQLFGIEWYENMLPQNSTNKGKHRTQMYQMKRRQEFY